MSKNINAELLRLLEIKDEVSEFSLVKKIYYAVNVVPISQAKYDEMLHNRDLDENTFYYILSREVGQYIEEYKDIEYLI